MMGFLILGTAALTFLYMAAAATRRYTGQGLIPSRWPELSKTAAIRLAPGTYPEGQALGQYSTITNTNDVQTITVTGTPTGGNIYLLFNGSVIGPLAYNAAAADLQTLLNACPQIGLDANGNPNAVASGGAFPGSALIITFSGTQMKWMYQPLITIQANNLTGGVAPAASVAHTTAGGAAGGLYGKYADANADGTGVGRGILKYACVVDTYGNITVGGGQWGETSFTATMYNRGVFDSSLIVGVDANFVTDVNGRYITGGSASVGTAGVEIELP